MGLVGEFRGRGYLSQYGLNFSLVRSVAIQRLLLGRVRGSFSLEEAALKMENNHVNNPYDEIKVRLQIGKKTRTFQRQKMMRASRRRPKRAAKSHTHQGIDPSASSLGKTSVVT